MIGFDSNLCQYKVFFLSCCLCVGTTASKGSVLSLNSAATNIKSEHIITAGQTYALTVSVVDNVLGAADRCRFELLAPDGYKMDKILHDGDPDMFFRLRCATSGLVRCSLVLEDQAKPLSVEVDWRQCDLMPGDELALEAEPNDRWQTANRIQIGRDVYGSADDVDYLDNQKEGLLGLDWFQFEVKHGPSTVFFRLELLDRDVSGNLALYQLDANSKLIPFEDGKDPTETVHDRERERYSKHLSRTLTNGTYYLCVNANHPHYILRTRSFKPPPYTDPTTSVEVGMQYLLSAGDAWLAQIPRGGNAFSRAENLHETATRCTACHVTIFPTEAALIAHRNGYAIQPKDAMTYLIERLYNSVTPLYGRNGLFWQRYIGIPLQSQGQGGSVLMDFERQVSFQKAPAFLRFGPFARAVWATKESLPNDESNGVVPLDSKFEFGWRDWRVLGEVARRTGDSTYLRAAKKLARLLTSEISNGRVETLQDKVHQLHARSLIDPGSIRDEAAYLFQLQNKDGGWHETESPGPSSIYMTGQIAWTLLEAGGSVEDPRIHLALDYLRERQELFGGWLQENTHENFRTPMRETRYAVMALAKAFPRGPPLSSWGDSEQKPRNENAHCLVEELDFLDSLWVLPTVQSALTVSNVLRLVTHPDAMVRARAAEVLGRLHQENLPKAIAGMLNDPSKLVWRAAAFSLRQHGNAGRDVEEILNALRSSDSAKRRGATRVFAYQFYGMDQRSDVASELIALVNDSDLWTRLQSIRSLRQWFYRTPDPDLQCKIIKAYVQRMATEDRPIVQSALVQGMYLMLDENLGGGVSLQKTISELPSQLQFSAIKGRKQLERNILHILFNGLTSGPALERSLILRSFDGSFLEGRTYARRPPNALDIGNDREFGMLYEPDLDTLNETFAALLTGENSVESSRMAVDLARFFDVPRRTTSETVQKALLKMLLSPNEKIKEAAAGAVSEMSVDAFRRSPRLQRALIEVLNTPGTGAPAMSLLGNAPDLIALPEILQAVRTYSNRPEAAFNLGPILAYPQFSNAEILGILFRGWCSSSLNEHKLAILTAIRTCESLRQGESIPAQLQEILTSAIRDPSSEVRESVLGILGAIKETPNWLVDLLRIALCEDVSFVRWRVLDISAQHEKVWQESQFRDALSRAITDPSQDIRKKALEIIQEHRLVRRFPELALRVRTLLRDPRLARLASSVLGAEGVDFEDSQQTTRWRQLPSVSTFRLKINPIFYQQGLDGKTCADCHATHSILRLVKNTSTAHFSEEALMINYRSAIRAVDVGDPNASLLLRKPMSPSDDSGRLTPDLTHSGDRRWSGRHSVPYKEILAWIRAAAEPFSAYPQGAATRRYYSQDMSDPNTGPEKAGDGNIDSFWRGIPRQGSSAESVAIIIDLESPRVVDGLLYVPRQDKATGIIVDYEIRLSEDGTFGSQAMAEGHWVQDRNCKYVALKPQRTRFVELRGLSREIDHNVCAGEIAVETPSFAQ